jgi:hypothetical protein
MFLYVYVVRQRLGKNLTAPMNTQAIIEEFLEASFLCSPCSMAEESAINIFHNFLLLSPCVHKVKYSTAPPGVHFYIILSSPVWRVLILSTLLSSLTRLYNEYACFAMT